MKIILIAILQYLNGMHLRTVMATTSGQRLFSPTGAKVVARRSS